MTSPDDDALDNGAALPSLDRLHQLALAGEVTAEEFLRACYQHVLRAVRSRRNRDAYLGDIDVEDYTQRVLSNALRTAGGKGDQLGLFPEVARIKAYLDKAVEYTLNTVHTGLKGVLPPLSIDAPIQGSDADTLHIEVADPSARIDVDGIAAVRARAKARRRTARLREEATAGQLCPYHVTAPCPHANPLIDFLEQAIEFGHLLTGEDIADLLAQKGRTLSLPTNRTGAGRKRQLGTPQTLSDHDHTLDRHFRRCFEWWWYRAFAGTDIDPVTERPAGCKPTEPSSRGDLLRLPIVDRLRLKKNGEWNSSACPLSGALDLILADEEFWRLLYKYKPDVADYLEGKTS